MSDDLPDGVTYATAEDLQNAANPDTGNSLPDRVRSAATAAGLDPETEVAMVSNESGFDPKAVNGTHRGLFQMADDTGDDYYAPGEDRTDPQNQIRAGIRYDADSAKSLRSYLGRDPTGGELRAAHVLGRGGAHALLTADDDTPLLQALQPSYGAGAYQVAKQNGLDPGGTVGDAKQAFQSEIDSKRAPPKPPAGLTYATQADVANARGQAQDLPDGLSYATADDLAQYTRSQRAPSTDDFSSYGDEMGLYASDRAQEQADQAKAAQQVQDRSHDPTLGQPQNPLVPLPDYTLNKRLGQVYNSPSYNNATQTMSEAPGGSFLTAAPFQAARDDLGKMVTAGEQGMADLIRASNPFGEGKIDIGIDPGERMASGIEGHVQRENDRFEQDLQRMEDQMLHGQTSALGKLGEQAQSFERSAPVMAGAIATGQPELVFGATTGLSKYGEARQEGESPLTAAESATLEGTTSAATAGITFAKALKGDAAVFPRLVESTGSMGLQNVSQELANITVENNVEGKQVSTDEAVDRVANAIKSSILPGMALGGFGAAHHEFAKTEADRIIERYKQYLGLPDAETGFVTEPARDVTPPADNSPMFTADEVKQAASARVAALQSKKEGLTPEEQRDLDFLNSNADNPAALAKEFKIPLESTHAEPSVDGGSEAVSGVASDAGVARPGEAAAAAGEDRGTAERGTTGEGETAASEEGLNAETRDTRARELMAKKDRTPEENTELASMMQGYVEQGRVSHTGEPMTGVLNDTARQRMLASGEIQPHAYFFDLDNFKPINDEYGYGAGNAVIRSAGEALAKNAPKGVVVFHKGGDEFIAHTTPDASPDALQQLHDQVNSFLDDHQVSYGDKDGKMNTIESPKFSGGEGADANEAERNLKADKQRKIATGERTERRATPRQGEAGGSADRPASDVVPAGAEADEVIGQRDDDSPRYSRATSDFTPLTKEQAADRLKKDLGSIAFARWIKAGGKLVHSSELDPAEHPLTEEQRRGVEGYTDEENTPHIVYDQVHPDNLAQVAVHETVHSNLRRILGDVGINQLANAIRLKNPELIARLPKDIPMGHLNEEIVAHALGDTQVKGRQKALDRFKLAVNKLGVPMSWLNAHEAVLADMGRRNLHDWANGRQGKYQVAGMRYNRAPEQPQSTRDAILRQLMQGNPKSPIRKEAPAPAAEAFGVNRHVKAEEIAARGADPVEAEGRRSMGDAWQYALERSKQDPHYAPRLAAELATNPRAISAEEVAALTQHGAHLNNQRDLAMDEIERARKDNDPIAQRQARVWLKETQELLAVHDRAAKNSGYEQSLGFNMRKMLATRDYSMQAQLRRFGALHDDGEVPPAVREKVKEQVDRIAQLTDELGKLKADVIHTAETAIPNAHNNTLAANARKADRVAALKAKFERGEWNGLTEAPEPVAPAPAEPQAPRQATQRAKTLHDKYTNILSRLAEATGKKLPEGAGTLYARDAVSPLVRQLAKVHVEAGVNDGRTLVSLIHKDVGEMTGLDHDQIARIIAGVRPETRPTREQHQSAMAEMKKQLRQLEPIASELRGRRERSKNAAELARSQKVLADLENQLATGKFTKAAHGTPVWNSDVQRVHNEIAAKRAEIADLKKLSEPSPEEKAKARRIKQLNELIADRQHRLDTGDYARPTKQARTPPAWKSDEQVIKLETELARSQRKLDQYYKAEELKQQGPIARSADFLVKLKRFNILTAINTLGKLSSAALARFVLTPAHELVGSGLKHLPMLNQVAGKAAREGHGFSLQAEGSALKNAFNWARQKDVLVHGHDDLDERYGGKADYVPSWADLPGHLHYFLKEPAKLNEYHRSLSLRSTHEYARVKAELAAKGLNDVEVQQRADEYMLKPSVQTILQAKALGDSMRAILQGENGAHKWYTNQKEMLRRNGAAGSWLAKSLDFAFPITRVPFNFITEVVQHAGGGLIAGYKINEAMKQARQAMPAEVWKDQTFGEKLSRAVDRMDPDTADYIMRNAKKQTVGALLALGYALGPGVFGGLGVSGDWKKHPRTFAQYLLGNSSSPTPAKKETHIGSYNLPSSTSDNPALMMLQIGAHARRLHDMENHETAAAMSKRFDGDYHGWIGQTAIKTGEEGLPFFDTPIRDIQTAKYGRGWGEVAGNEIRSTLIPAAVQNIAALHDPHPGFRAPQNIWQDIETGIPFLREQVPEQREKKQR